MATVIGLSQDRPILKCSFCGLTQWPRLVGGLSGECRRCRRNLDEEPQDALEPEPPPPPAMPSRWPSDDLGATIRRLRLEIGMSQRRLAGIMDCPRTYISKIECSKAIPTLSSLERVSAALNVSMSNILNASDRELEKQTAELRGDSFIASLVPFVPRLGHEQRRLVLAQIRDMTMRRARIA